MAHLRRNIIMGLFGAAIVGGLAYVAFRPEPIAVDIHTVERGVFTITVNADGETRVRDIYDIASPIDGVARRSPFDVGDRVLAGQTVSEVEPTVPTLLDARTRLQSEAAIREAEAALNVAESDLARSIEDQTFAQAEYDRTSRLVDRGVATIARLDDARRVLAVANAAVQASRARIAQAKSTLQRVEAALIDPSSMEEGNEEACCVPIASPIDGAVLAIDVVSEKPVTSGEKLLSVGDPSDIEIVADLLSYDALRLRPGAKAKVERWGGVPLTATLSLIEPTARTKVSALGIEEQRVDVIFQLESPIEERPMLGHGFAVFLRIVEYKSQDTLTVPLSAAFRSGEGWAVFRVNEGWAERVPVELGRRNTQFAEVVSGLEPGDQVVTHPSDQLTDGGLIEQRRQFDTE